MHRVAPEVSPGQPGGRRRVKVLLVPWRERDGRWMLQRWVAQRERDCWRRRQTARFLRVQ